MRQRPFSHELTRPSHSSDNTVAYCAVAVVSSFVQPGDCVERYRMTMLRDLF